MKIGETIKRLRKQKDMTQEQLAAYLNISPQAVSRWEINSTMPDITFIPVLANIFNVTSDILLGIDIDNKEKRINEIKTKAEHYIYAKKNDKAEKLLREALKEYPNNCILMYELSLVEKNQYEIISLCEKIIAESKDDYFRYVSLQRLCYAYVSIGETEKAITIAKKMPYKFQSREYLLSQALKGTERFTFLQEQIAFITEDILNFIAMLIHTRLDDETEPFNIDELIEINHKTINIINIFIEKGSFGEFNFRLMTCNSSLAYYYLQKNDYISALQYLKLAAEYAIKYDAMPNVDADIKDEYDCLLFKGVKYPLNMADCGFTAKERLLEGLNNPIYLNLPALELLEIKNKLLL